MPTATTERIAGMTGPTAGMIRTAARQPAVAVARATAAERQQKEMPHGISFCLPYLLFAALSAVAAPDFFTSFALPAFACLASCFFFQASARALSFSAFSFSYVL